MPGEDLRRFQVVTQRTPRASFICFRGSDYLLGIS